MCSVSAAAEGFNDTERDVAELVVLRRRGRHPRLRRAKVNPSALKHGIEPDDAVHAAAHWVFVSDLDEGSPARQLRLGFDTAG